jgi:hypothetical protein
MLDYVGAILGCLEAILDHVGLSWDHLRPSWAVLRPFWIMLGCIEAMLWLSGEHLGPYWDGMGVKVWEMPRRLGGPGHKVCVLPRGRGCPGHKVWVLPRGLGGHVGRKSKGPQALQGFGSGFGLWGVGGDLASESQIEVLWIFGYTAM